MDSLLPKVMSAAAPAMPSAAQITALIEGVRSLYTVRFAELASSSIIIWEHIVTFDQEVKLVWGARWSLGKIIFLINRYYTLSAVITNNVIMFYDGVNNNVRRQWFIWQGATGLISVALSQITLMLRLYALYQLNRLILAIMIIVFIGSVGAAAAILFINLAKVYADAHLIPGMPACVPLGLSDHFWVYWIPILTCESLLCALALYRAFSGALIEPLPDARDKNGTRRGQSVFMRRLGAIFRNGQRIVDVLIRDSILFFLVMFAAYLTNALIWIYGSSHIFEIPIGFSEAMACVLSCRLLLNVRHVHAQMQQADAENAHPMHSLSGQPRASPGPAVVVRTSWGAVQTRSGGPVHICTVVETITVRDGEDDDMSDKVEPLGTPDSERALPVYSTRHGDIDETAARPRSTLRSARNDLTDSEVFQLRTMKSY